MKVCFVSRRIAPDFLGSMEKFGRQLSNFLGERGHSVRLVTQRGSKENVLNNQFFTLFSNFRVPASSDVVFLNSMCPGLFFRMFSMPVVYYAHGAAPDYFNDSPFTRRIVWLEEYLTVRRANKILVPTRRVKDRLCKLYGLNEKKIVVVPYGEEAKRLKGYKLEENMKRIGSLIENIVKK